MPACVPCAPMDCHKIQFPRLQFERDAINRTLRFCFENCSFSLTCALVLFLFFTHNWSDIFANGMKCISCADFYAEHLFAVLAFDAIPFCASFFTMIRFRSSDYDKTLFFLAKLLSFLTICNFFFMCSLTNRIL